MQNLIDELVSYGNSQVDNFEPSADKSLPQFKRMALYIADYGEKWLQVVRLMREKKIEIIEKQSNLGMDISGLDEILETSMLDVKKTFHEKYAPKKSP